MDERYEPEMWMCDLCGEKYADLRRHMILLHSGELAPEARVMPA